MVLVNLYNKSWDLGTFPTAWKAAMVKIIPKPKSKNKSSVKAYRPISLIPVMGKILEKLLNDRLKYHLYSK